jgi:adenosylhomocysteine nucleosidase
MTKILVAFALREEFAPWRRRHRFRPVGNSPHRVTMASFGSTEVYVALAGAGAPHAHSFDDLTTLLAPSLGIVTGVAAGLKPQWRPGDLLVARSVSGPEGSAGIPAARHLIDIAERCGARPADSLLTLPRIARTLEEKMRLANRGDAADMESLPLIMQWSARGIPSLALRVILDPVEMPMTCDFEAAMDAHGQVRVTRILAQLARRPQLLPDFLHLARESRRAMKILAGFLDRFMEDLDTHSLPSPAI